MTDAILRAQDLGKTFGGGGGLWRSGVASVTAVDGVSLDIGRGETLALVGESGSGKSTLGRLLLRLIDPSTGTIQFNGTELTRLRPAELRRLRSEMQIVFQDPFGSLSPRRTIAEIIGEPLGVFASHLGRRARRDKVAALLAQVGLPPSVMDRHPRHFSGGQRQRIGIARAISVDPSFIVADEPVSALDVSVQAQIINLMQDLQEQRGFTFLFIAHDLAVVRHIADRVAVMYLGRIAEIGPKRSIYTAPQHPYTEALLSAAPEVSLDPLRSERRIILKGDLPSPSRIPAGCSFHTRCPIVQSICRTVRPPLADVAPGHSVACHFAAPNPIRTARGQGANGSVSPLGGGVSGDHTSPTHTSGGLR